MNKWDLINVLFPTNILILLVYRKLDEILKKMK